MVILLTVDDHLGPPTFRVVGPANYINGALVPTDTLAVAAGGTQHLSAKGIHVSEVSLSSMSDMLSTVDGHLADGG